MSRLWFSPPNLAGIRPAIGWFIKSLSDSAPKYDSLYVPRPRNPRLSCVASLRFDFLENSGTFTPLSVSFPEPTFYTLFFITVLPVPCFAVLYPFLFYLVSGLRLTAGSISPEFCCVFFFFSPGPPLRGHGTLLSHSLPCVSLPVVLWAQCSLHS